MNHFKKLRCYLVEILISEDRISEATQILRSYDEFQVRAKGYFLYASRNDFGAAKTYLENLIASNSEEMDFVNSQLIYIESLLDENYKPKPIDLKRIFDAGQENTVLAGFSRSIYLYFTEELIELQFYVEGYNTQPRRSLIKTDNEQFSVFPNPIRSGSLIVNGFEADKGDSYEVVFRSVLGDVVLTGKNNGSETLQIDDFEGTGVFILSVTRNGKHIYSEKVIKL